MLPTFAPGTVLAGTYRIQHAIAAGGMGEVYVAAHERLPGRFAVKVLHKECRDEEALSRFRSEAEIMAGLRHPHVVQVVDFNVTPEGTPYLVMELVDGKDLAELVKEGEPMPPLRVAAIIRQVASALEAAHAHGVVHRDLKPENVMVVSLDAAEEEFVKVVDFGVSKASWTQRITADCTILGTPQFMAPEQAQGRREEVDHRTDQFALAAMAYMLLTGREPFRGDTAVTVLYQVVHQDPEPISRFLSWPCPSVDAVIRRGMAKDREARFPGVLDFAKALDEAIVEDLKLPMTKTPSTRLKVVAAAQDLASMAPTARTDATMATVRMGIARRTGKRVVAAGAAGTAVVLALMLYLTSNGWGRVAGGVGAVYRHTVGATTRIARGERPSEVVVRPAGAPDAGAATADTLLAPSADLLGGPTLTAPVQTAAAATP